MLDVRRQGTYIAAYGSPISQTEDVLASSSLIAEAKTLIQDHERLFESGDLDAVMRNFADDVVVMALDTPVLAEKAALRNFYAGLMGLGVWSFRHDYTGEEAVESCVFLHGVARGTHTPRNGDAPFSFANNFLIVTREVGGRMLVWRAAFMPGAEE
jgi:ketosteroid isomerase-like protein